MSFLDILKSAGHTEPSTHTQYSENKTYVVTSKAGNSTVISARTESDAFQKASSFAGDDLIDDFKEL